MSMSSRARVVSLLALFAALPACLSSSSNNGPGSNVGPDGGATTDAGATDGAATDTDGGVKSTCTPPTGPGTKESGPINANTTWTAAASPHVLDASISIAVGATLTLEPCAIVQLGAGVSLTVNGRLDAPGTPASAIRIEATDPAKPFGAIQTANGGIVDLANVTIRNGGNDAFEDAPLFIRGDNTALKPVVRAVNVTIEGASKYGLVIGSFAQLSADSTALTIRGAGAAPVRASAQSAGSLPRGTYTGNAIDEILLDADAPVAANMTLPNLGVPYHLGDTTQNASGDLRVGTSTKHAVLTVEAGVTIRVDKAGRIVMQSTGDASQPAAGALVANGTPANPIVFTSAAATPAAGDWIGLHFAGVPDAADRLDHVRVDYAGAASGAISFHCGPDPMNAPNESEDAAIMILGGPPSASFVINSTIAHSKGYGIDRGWSGAAVDFAATNTFDQDAKCTQSAPRNANGSCPNPTVCN